MLSFRISSIAASAVCMSPAFSYIKVRNGRCKHKNSNLLQILSGLHTRLSTRCSTKAEFAGVMLTSLRLYALPLQPSRQSRALELRCDDSLNPLEYQTVFVLRHRQVHGRPLNRGEVKEVCLLLVGWLRRRERLDRRLEFLLQCSSEG